MSTPITQPHTTIQLEWPEPRSNDKFRIHGLTPNPIPLDNEQLRQLLDALRDEECYRTAIDCLIDRPPRNVAEGRILGLFHSVWDGLTSVPHGASLGELNEEFCQHITDIDTALCEAANYFNNFVRSELKKLLEENQ